MRLRKIRTVLQIPSKSPWADPHLWRRRKFHLPTHRNAHEDVAWACLHLVSHLGCVEKRGDPLGNYAVPGNMLSDADLTWTSLQPRGCRILSLMLDHCPAPEHSCRGTFHPCLIDTQIQRMGLGSCCCCSRVYLFNQDEGAGAVSLVVMIKVQPAAKALERNSSLQFFQHPDACYNKPLSWPARSVVDQSQVAALHFYRTLWSDSAHTEIEFANGTIL
ncbi:uncharacterized protein BO72DRAFT_129406 [Aspergillus fijiensis CBS 313.89]|uniref:CPAF-like PDZ domain-containing protein n=1 Tax=Aspergillus fijiensis CBS 313.89 TaxID=1448319 RepID=A0A8G1RTJ7_9EURO|nr:uncharacterized protein BO72DRAFT_129406 [Aspergillus fijiensis CBS 313.89]RAK76506.1 hypothetical protein BO72DRAFT_129406 [Aspergillus fijiensis CBS 313.89]